MKRRNQGYVLALVLVVTLLLSSVASLLTVSVVRNIEAGGVDFALEAEAAELDGMIEQIYANLAAWKHSVKNMTQNEDDAPLRLEFQIFLRGYVDTYLAAHDDGNVRTELSIGDATEVPLDADAHSYCYLIPIQATYYDVSGAVPLVSTQRLATIALEVRYGFYGPAEETGPLNAVEIESVSCDTCS